MHDYIRLARKVLRFFGHFFFTFLATRTQLTLGFNNIYAAAIYDLSPTHWYREEPAFVEVQRLLAKVVVEVRFEVVFAGKFFLARPSRQEFGKTRLNTQSGTAMVTH